MKNNLVITIVAAIVVGALSFYGGTIYQKSQPAVRGTQAGAQAANGRQARNGGANGSRPVNGEIVSVGEKSISVKLQDGSSKIVLLTDKTSINKAADATVSDIKSGERVAAFGTDNSDGSITATNIQLNPTFRNMTPNGSPRP